LVALVVGVVTAGSPVAAGAPRPANVGIAKAPAATAGTFVSVAAVPHSTDVWAAGYVGSSDDARFFVARRHHWHWQKVTAPKLGGRYASLTSVAAVSVKNVWLARNRQVAHSINQVPAIWRWSGKKFVAQKLPARFAGECAVESISASSATNVWSVGSVSPVTNSSIVMLHYNGKPWSTVPFPELNARGAVSVSTSSATNAWATDGTSLYHWDGKSWTTDGTPPTGAVFESVATDSAHLAYAVGYIQNSLGAFLRS
jgi:hypothetical protein